MECTMCWKQYKLIFLSPSLFWEWFCTEPCVKAALCIDLAVRTRRQPAVHFLGWRKERGTAGQGWLNNMRRRNNIIECQGWIAVVENHPWQLGWDAACEEVMWTHIQLEKWRIDHPTELKGVIKNIPKYNTILGISLQKWDELLTPD